MPGRLKQEEFQLEVSLGYMARCLSVCLGERKRVKEREERRREGERQTDRHWFSHMCL